MVLLTSRTHSMVDLIYFVLQNDSKSSGASKSFIAFRDPQCFINFLRQKLSRTAKLYQNVPSSMYFCIMLEKECTRVYRDSAKHVDLELYPHLRPVQVAELTLIDHCHRLSHSFLRRSLGVISIIPLFRLNITHQ
jgi:hypothetical protein